LSDGGRVTNGDMIEIDDYPGDDPASRLIARGNEIDALKKHP